MKPRKGRVAPTKRELWAAHTLWASGCEDQARLQKAVDELGIAEPKARVKRPSTKPPEPSEHQEQAAFVKWFRLQYPGVLIFAIPNGGARDPITGAMLKAEGVTPDVPDLEIPAWRMYVEMKKRSGRVDPDQEKMHEYLRGCGYHVVTCMGCDEAILAVRYQVKAMKEAGTWE